MGRSLSPIRPQPTRRSRLLVKASARHSPPRRAALGLATQAPRVGRSLAFEWGLDRHRLRPSSLCLIRSLFVFLCSKKVSK